MFAAGHVSESSTARGDSAGEGLVAGSAAGEDSAGEKRMHSPDQDTQEENAALPCKKQKFGAKAYGCVYMYMQYIVLGMYVYVANACMYFWHTVCIHIHTRKYAYAYV